MKPVKSESSKTQEELEKVKEERNKLRNRVKDYHIKFSKMNTSLLSSIEEDGQGSAMKVEDQQKFIKRFSQDKVISSIVSLTEKNEDESKRLKEQSM